MQNLRPEHLNSLTTQNVVKPESKMHLTFTNTHSWDLAVADSYAVAHMNAIIHDMAVRIERGDTMINPKFKDAAGRIAGHDVVVANPMWNQDFKPGHL